MSESRDYAFRGRYVVAPSSQFKSRLDSDSYPHKYLKPAWQQRRAKQAVTGRRAAKMSWSLVIPILVVLMISITIGDDGAESDFDAQSALRVAAYLAAALSVLFALGRSKLPADGRIISWTLVPIFITWTALYAPQPLFSVAAGLAHLTLMLFAWRVVTRHGQTGAVLAIVVGGLIVGALSILAFYAYPDVGGALADPLTGETVYRMRGLTAQPNSLGFIGAVTALFAIMYFHTFTARQRALGIVAVILAAFCVVYSDSRTSIAALLFCLLLWGIYRANAAFNLFIVTAVALAVTVVVIFVPDVSAYISRTGSGSDELASLNGRSRIWAVAWESIQAHPVFGEGYGSSRLLLPTDDRLFGAAINTHNLYLELLFSGGAILFALFVIAVTVTIFRSVRRGRAEALIALLFFLVRGSAEAAPFAGLPLFPAYAFYTAVALCLARSIHAGNVTGATLSFRDDGPATSYRPAFGG